MAIACLENSGGKSEIFGKISQKIPKARKYWESFEKYFFLRVNAIRQKQNNYHSKIKNFKAYFHCFYLLGLRISIF